VSVEEYRREFMRYNEDDGTGNWVNLLARGGWQVVPHCHGVEFEIKYAPRAAAPDAGAGALGDYVRLLHTAALPENLFAPHSLAFRESTADYWLVDGVEWSRQRFRGRERLKRKVHSIFHAEGGGPLIQSQETFLEDPDRVAAVVGDLTSSIGSLRRTLAKGHLVRLDLGIVFNLSESRCYLGDAEQIQVELEYGAHLYRDVDGPIPDVGPAELRAMLWDVERAVAPILRGAGLAPTTEKKRDFVLAARKGGNDAGGR
jgi:hypothetical protein